MIQNENFGKIRKQVMPINPSSDETLNVKPQQSIERFVYENICKIVKERRPIEIEGKLGRFMSKSMSPIDIKENEIRIDMINTISREGLVFLRPFESIFSFNSTVLNKTQSDQIKYFDSVTDWKEEFAMNENMKNKGPIQQFGKYVQIDCVYDFSTFSRSQNDVIVDFTFEDGTRLKVPLNPTKPVSLDKKDRNAVNNLDFALQANHYRISAREETEITEIDKINEKIMSVRQGNYLSVRVKYRKAYRYLFMEFAFTRVLGFKRVNKKMQMHVQDQLEQEIFDEFKKEVAEKILSRKTFQKEGLKFFQKCYDLKYNDHIKFETELEIKDVIKYFGIHFKDNSEMGLMEIHSQIRAFIRNLISLNQTNISDFFGNYYLHTIKIPEGDTLTSLSIYKPNIIGQYFEND